MNIQSYRYERIVTASAKRSLKRLPRRVREDLLQTSAILETDPLAGEKLSGALHFLYSFHFKSQNVAYRLAYTVDHDKAFNPEVIRDSMPCWNKEMQL